MRESNNFNRRQLEYLPNMYYYLKKYYTNTQIWVYVLSKSAALLLSFTDIDNWTTKVCKQFKNNTKEAWP